MGIVAGLVVGFTLRAPQTATRTPVEAMDAASRDGAYLAKLDVENGRKPRFASGRWSSNSDRALFITAYEEGYQEASESRIGSEPKATANEKAGYRQGVADGAADQAASLPFRPDKTTLHYLKVGQDSIQSNDDEIKFRQEYRYAYINGYQQGYYSTEKAPEWAYYAQ